MQIFLFNGGGDANQAKDLERRIRDKLPDLQIVSRLEEISKALPKNAERSGELACILFPVVLNSPESFDRMVSIATEYRDSLFFIFISDDIPARDYKRLVQTGGADWASTRGAPDEILDILSRLGKESGPDTVEAAPSTEPVMVAFVPGAGGVGNSTLAIEVGIQIKTAKRSRNRRVCLIDLDFQNSHVCDYLDIEARMQIQEIARNPERLDKQLFDLFVSHHSSGLDVLAAPRSKGGPADIDPAALEALFQMIAARYDLILLDLPVAWFNWTRQLLSAVEVTVVSGLNTIPGLRQVAETLAAVRAVERVPPKIVVVLNRCEHRLVGGFARRNHVTNLLASEEVIYVRDCPDIATHAVNTGIPMTVEGTGKASKDISPVALIVSEAKPVVAAGTGPQRGPE
ncbi:hypothetical protein [Bradyrhizobium jicamae]|uniref:AAA family ATPase n=1 Tax=Bradyrhizobium jicamae TaxID=280332 RepID=UPI001BA453F6|nr:hypothetical protein [Bradyrhizobium jicamae]MBR0939089.1 hypothetical protein [Bradyrhizobium jicamae]